MTALSRLGLTSVSLCRSFTCCRQWSVRFVSDVPYQERKIDIVTCRHLFPKHTDKGLNFEVTYIDEKPPKNAGKDVLAEGADDMNSGRLPVVLMLHGSPGSYVDLKAQIECLVKRGIRVIAPNFPDLPTIRKHRYPAFRNTPLNKSSLIRDFLKTLGVSKNAGAGNVGCNLILRAFITAGKTNPLKMIRTESRIDMLVTHSSGTYTGLRLYLNSELPDVDAFAMINPAGHWHTCTNPRWFFQTLGELVHWRLGYGLFKVIGMRVFPLLGPVDVPNIDEPLLSLTAIRSFDLNEVKEGLLQVKSRRPPLLFTFSENDKLIGRKVSYDMLKILGCDRKDWWFYDDKGQLKKTGRDDTWIKAISFEAGSHYSFRKHPNVINSALLQLFDRLPIAKTTLPITQEAGIDVQQKAQLESEKTLGHTPTAYPEANRLKEQNQSNSLSSPALDHPVQKNHERAMPSLERPRDEPVLVQRLVTTHQEIDKHTGDIYQEKQEVRL